MKRHAPLLTLLAVAALGVALLVVSSLSNPANRDADTAAPPATTEPAAPATTAAPEPAVPAPAVAEQAYAGRSSGNEVTVAIAVKDGRAVAYVCNGKKIEAWLEGTLQGDQLSLQGKDGAAITGTVDDAKSLGTVAVAGKQWPYAAKTVQAPEGLYQGRANIDGVAARIGWIAVDGTVTGNARNAAGVVVPAPTFDPNAPEATTADGVKVDVDTVGGSDQVIF